MIGDQIHIASCADKNYLFPVATMLNSVSLQHPEASITATLLVSECMAEARGLVKELAPAVEIELYDINSYLEDLPTSLRNVSSRVAYARLLLPKIVPTDINRILYLDADVIVCSSLVELWTLPLPAGCSLGAVYDAYIPWAASPDGTAWQSLRLAPDMPYFNSGVMLISLDEWRKQGIGERAIELANANTLPYDDQCALNAVVRGNWKVLKPTWNFQSAYLHGWHYGWVNYGERCFEDALKQPAIIHYTSGGKPWLTREHPLSCAFYNVVDQTKFAGWRPGQNGEPWKSN